jgi:Helix-turn-helix domain
MDRTAATCLLALALLLGGVDLAAWWTWHIIDGLPMLVLTRWVLVPSASTATVAVPHRGRKGSPGARTSTPMAAISDTARTLTIAEAAQLTGLSRKAIRSRVDRGTVRAVLRDGVRRIPHSELERAGLLDQAGDVVAAPAAGPRAAGAGQGSPAEASVIGELLDRLERQAGELAELRLLTRQAESLQVVADQERDRAERLAGEVHELRAQLAAAEARAGQQARRRWWQRGDRGNPEAAAPAD